MRIIAARGPLNIAGFLMTIPEFCVAVKTDPDRVHRLLDKTTELVIRWLEAQAEAAGEIGGILLLDDICGFFSEEEYLEFAHPRLKRIFDHFSVPVKMFHNDNFGNRYTTFPHIADLGVNLFNFSCMGVVIINLHSIRVHLLEDTHCIIDYVFIRQCRINKILWCFYIFLI